MAHSPTVGEALVGLLEAVGVDTVFGIPGVHTVELYRGLANSSIRHITPRHEQGAGFMADGYAAVTGRPGVCFVITGPGVTNTVTAIAQAYHDSRPMLVISSAMDSAELGMGRGGLHDLPDQQALTATICGFSKIVTDPEELPELLQRAYTMFEMGRPRPVHLSIPTDVLAQPSPRLEPLSIVVEPSVLDSASISAAADTLARANRVMMILGGGSLNAGSATTAIAELVGSPIVLTGNAKGVVSTLHPLCLGCSLPTEAVLDAIRDADVVLAVGTELSSLEELSLERELEIRGELVRIDVDASRLSNPIAPGVGVCGDASTVLAALLQELSRRDLGTVDGVARAGAIRDAIRWWPQVDSHRPWMDAIGSSLPEDSVVAVDSTQLGYSLHNTLPWNHPRSWLAPYGYGTLGPALPMAIGAKSAVGGRPVVAVAGDGGALFTIAELAASMQHRLPIVLLVWNNCAYQEITDSLLRVDARPIGTELSSVDFALLGRSLGCNGVRVATPDELSSEITQALATNTTTVVDVSAAP